MDYNRTVKQIVGRILFNHFHFSIENEIFLKLNFIDISDYINEYMK